MHSRRVEGRRVEGQYIHEGVTDLQECVCVSHGGVVDLTWRGREWGKGRREEGKERMRKRSEEKNEGE